MLLSKQEMLEVKGGALTAALFNAVVGGFKFIVELGQTIGSSISRLINKNFC